MAESDEPKSLGLALSGGGLRAAFFHVGVLARLADLRLLSSIRVLSTVSGGSIVGALLYLHLKRRYEGEQSSDRQIVEEILRALTRAGKQDLRTSAFRNPIKSLRMGLAPGFSRSDRMAELYERLLYRPFAPSPPQALGRRLVSAIGDTTAFWRGRPRVRLRDLQISGASDPPPLQLMVNATSLNTGHGWRFEATMMGEPRRGPVRRVLDDNERLQRIRFADEPPQRFAEFDLARAVAASACFPGFEPLPLSGLYEDRKVELVDGGIFDNQGVHALRHRDCSHYVVSDGAGRLEDARRPHTRVLAVLGRAYGIAAGRVREDQLLELLGAAPSSAIVDIKGGCAGAPVPWQGRGNPADDEEENFVELPGLDALDLPTSSSAWNVHPEIQLLLSELRTDLDHFSEVERHSLMLAGYSNAVVQLERPGGIAQQFEVPESSEQHWCFQDVAPLMDPPNGNLSARYVRQLRAGRRRLFRLPSLLPVSVVVPVGLVAAAAIVWGYRSVARDRDDQLWILDSVWQLFKSDVPAAVLIILALLWTIPMLVPPAYKERSDYFGRALMWGILPFLLWPVVLLQLYLVRPLYQWFGRVSRLL